jgi:hypothetical protein
MAEDEVAAARRRLEQARQQFTPEMRQAVEGQRIDSAINHGVSDPYGYSGTRRMKPRRSINESGR